MEKDEAKLKKRLSSYYDKEYRKLEKEISGYYQQYGEDNVIKYRNLMESLPDEDKRLLIERMDDFADKYPEYADILPVRESIYKLNRLEGLQTSVRVQQLEIGAVNNQALQMHLEKQAFRGANAAAEMMGFGLNYYANNPDIVNRFVNVPWSNGKNFSERIWNNSGKLADYLNTDIAQGIARGDSYDRLVRNVRQKFSRVTRNDAFRLIYTEGTFVQAESTIQPFIEDFDKYRISTVEDEKVCPICRAASNHVFRIQDRQPGVNFPPFHAWCRCTFTVEVDDWDKWMDGYEAKYNNGKSKSVTKNLTTSNDEPIEANEDDKVRLKAEDFGEPFNKKGEAKNSQKLVDYINGVEGANPDMIQLYKTLGRQANFDKNGIKFSISHAKGHAVKTVSRGGVLEEVKLTIPKLTGNNITGQAGTVLHENMHLLDLIYRKDPNGGAWFSSGNKELAAVFDKTDSKMSDAVARLFEKHDAEYKRIYSSANAKYRKEFDTLFDQMSDYKKFKAESKKLQSKSNEATDYEARNIMGGGIGNLQDIYDALSKGELQSSHKLLFGHGKSYYSSSSKRIEETVANYASLSVTRPDLVDLLRQDKPELVAELENNVKKMLEKAGGK